MRSFKLSLPLILLVGLILLAIPRGANATGVKISPASFCKGKNKYMYQAINRFCSKTNLVAPSAYATSGARSSPPNASVRINGQCKPAQWIPQKYCRQQMFDLCVRGDEYGANEARYGNGGCQYWKLVSQSK